MNLVGDGSKLTNLNLAVDGSKLTNLTLVGDGSHLTNIKLVGNGSQLTNLNLVGDGSKLTNLNFSGFSSTLPSNTLGTNGSYTPIIGDGTHSFTTSSSKGYFAKFGNQVYFEAWVLWSSKGSAAGPLVVSLPFTNASQRPCFSMGFMAGVVGTNGTCFIPNAVAGATNVSIYTYNISTGASSPVPISACAASGELQISGTYRWQ